MWGSGDAIRGRALVLLAVLALLAAACSDRKPQTRPTPGASSPGGTASASPGGSGSPSASPGVSPSATTSPGAERSAQKVVYVRGGDLYLYTVSNNALRRLTDTQANEYDPKFIDGDRITFLTFQDPVATITEMRLSTRARRVLFSSSSVGRIMVHTWSPGRSTIAYLTTDTNASKHDLRFVTASGSDRRVRAFGAFQGREYIDDDSIHVEWAPDGKAVLVVMTPLEKGPTMYVVRGTGSNVIAGHNGTFARWARDGKHVYFREFGDKRRWFMISVPGNVGTLMKATPNTFRPALSIDGKTLVFDDGKASPSIYAYTIATKTQVRVGRGLDPLWLSAAALAVSNTIPCVATDQDPCFDPYTKTDTVDRLTYPDGARRRLALRSTAADVLYG
jgi:Tol biopolymer transport system component